MTTKFYQKWKILRKYLTMIAFTVSPLASLNAFAALALETSEFFIIISISSATSPVSSTISSSSKLFSEISSSCSIFGASN